jgi:hypothetical protein
MLIIFLEVNGIFYYPAILTRRPDHREPVSPFPDRNNRCLSAP